ncbi:MAG: class I SAM-dependent methyltransferase, partial [Acidobacteriota bacterium]
MSKHILLGSPIDELLDNLYSRSTGETDDLVAYFSRRFQEGSLRSYEFDEDAHRFLSDKLVALDREKAEFCYQICRALRAKRVVEAGTSFGVSTLFLAAAVRENTRADDQPGVVIATEHETSKAKSARATFTTAGLLEYVDLREGDLRQTLLDVAGPIDFMLLDIWTPMALPALELVAPLLRAGAVIIADNTEQFRDAYSDYFAFVNDPANKLCTMTLPF